MKRGISRCLVVNNCLDGSHHAAGRTRRVTSKLQGCSRSLTVVNTAHLGGTGISFLHGLTGGTNGDGHEYKPAIPNHCRGERVVWRTIATDCSDR